MKKKTNWKLNLISLLFLLCAALLASSSEAASIGSMVAADNNP